MVPTFRVLSEAAEVPSFRSALEVPGASEAGSSCVEWHGGRFGRFGRTTE